MSAPISGAEETLLDLWKRWADWLEYYVKDKHEPDEEDHPPKVADE